MKKQNSSIGDQSPMNEYRLPEIINKAFGLKQYAILTSAFLTITSSTNAEIIYADIDPDSVLDENDEYAFLDFDFNGNVDFAITKLFATSTTFTYYGNMGANFTRNVLWIGGLMPENIIAASSATLYDSGSFLTYYAYALASGENIPGDLEFQGGEYQRIAFKSFINDGIPWNEGGNWFPEQTDKYLGVRFIGEDTNFHFGWIRCTVEDSANVIIIKDFAYEVIEDKAIKAGDIGIDAIDENVNNSDVRIFSFKSDIFIQVNDLSFNHQVKIFNNLGQLIREEEITELNSVIDLHNVAIGNYFVEVFSGDRKIVEKVFIN